MSPRINFYGVSCGAHEYSARWIYAKPFYVPSESIINPEWWVNVFAIVFASPATVKTGEADSVKVFWAVAKFASAPQLQEVHFKYILRE